MGDRPVLPEMPDIPVNPTLLILLVAMYSPREIAYHLFLLVLSDMVARILLKVLERVLKLLERRFGRIPYDVQL